ncbi:melanization protease 1-like isoform X3 [Thrips palmi]|uniref:CLIP domain-containing serine protease n=1 Tax=Thrips palmi TaxID=161013 RepID=A0A6P8Y9P7_THRPL|nr:melanization protease 1-like isoform X3 [Thrips palmi]
MTSRPCLLMIILLVCTSYTGGALTGKECQTPDNKMGACIPLLKCPSLLHRFNEEPLTPASKTFLRASNCGAAEQSVPDVCCEKLDLPTMGCGDGVIPKIMGGEEAKLGEHPWMALFNIYYYNANVTMFGCGGSLINKRYVLSAAHCASTPKENRINFVRLGEHNIETSPDCQYDHAAKSTFCADKAIDYTVEMEIVHEDYNPRNVTNDVLLIRLSTDVVYTDFIKPLCLPEIEEVLPFPEVGALLTVVGWGRSREGQEVNNLKLQVRLPVFLFSDCRAIYRTKRREIYSDLQFCAGGQKKKDSCGGDSGGPLMRPVLREGRLRWEIVGIVSFGPGACALINFPGVYVKVAHYLQWIQDRIQF